MAEYLDILNEHGELTGEKQTHADVHKQGFLHRTAHVWLLNSKGELLIQKRAPTREVHPNEWDISAAGHVSAGETSLEGAKRETKEELGLEFPDEAFKYLFTIRHHRVQNNGTHTNNEMQDVYLVHADATLEDLKMQKEEMSEIRWVKVTELEKLIREKKEPFVPHDQEYEMLFERISARTYR